MSNPPKGDELTNMMKRKQAAQEQKFTPRQLQVLTALRGGAIAWDASDGRWLQTGPDHDLVFDKIYQRTWHWLMSMNILKEILYYDGETGYEVPPLGRRKLAALLGGEK